MRFERQTVRGLDLRVARVSHGGRPTLVLTNAFPQSIRCWESLWERLAARFDLLAVDLPGFGMSGGAGPVMRPSAQADALVQLMADNRIDRAFMVGPDVGVPVSLWLATTHPERVSGINIFDGPGMWPTDFDPALGAATRSGLVRWLGTHWPMRRRLMEQNFAVATSVGYHHFRPSEAAVREYETICFDPVKHRNAFRFLGSYARELPLLEQRLAALSVPVLITWGAHDRFVRPSNAKRLHERLPHSELTIFDNAGHFSHEDADAAWLSRLESFIATHCDRDSEADETRR
ncbi:MAG: alpha/beta hydrolase [Myxococcales bacterium FL481]|nr:MAG: alpha/beta hydrolase [Myxococcales bacterium FL481]